MKTTFLSKRNLTISIIGFFLLSIQSCNSDADLSNAAGNYTLNREIVTTTGTANMDHTISVSGANSGKCSVTGNLNIPSGVDVESQEAYEFILTSVEVDKNGSNYTLDYTSDQAPITTFRVKTFTAELNGSTLNVDYQIHNTSGSIVISGDYLKQ